MSRARKFIRTVARRRAKGLPEVRTSDGHMVPWNRRYIVNQLLRETILVEELFKVRRISREEAEEVSKIVEERIRKLGLAFISAPLIREMVNNVLLELSERDPKFALYRNVCTRCGVPVYDAYIALYEDEFSKRGEVANPSLICERIAERTVREVALLLMEPHIADSHLKGDIHIHSLEYFGLKPLYVGYDIRCFLLYGLVPDGTGTLANVAAPARRFDVALRHASMVMSSGATHVAKSQIHIAFNVFLSPYARGIKEDEIRQGIQSLFFEISQAYAVHGGSHDFAVIQIVPKVPRIFRRAKVALRGVLTEETYEVYLDETSMLFDEIMRVYLDGDAKGNPFYTPLMSIYIEDLDDLKKVHAYLPEVLNTYKVINVDINPKGDVFFCTHGGNFMLPIEVNESILNMERGAHVNTGISQVVSVNMPRLVFRAKGDEDKLRDQIYKAVSISVEVFKLKEEWLMKMLEGGKLQFLAQRIGETKLVDVNKLSNVIGLVGLREAVQCLCEKSIYTEEGLKMAKKIITWFKDAISEYDSEEMYHISLTECYDEEVTSRLATSDLVTPTYRYSARKIVKGDLKETTRLLKIGARNLPIRYTSTRDVIIDVNEDLFRKKIYYEIALREALPCIMPLIIRTGKHGLPKVVDVLKDIIIRGTVIPIRIEL